MHNGLTKENGLNNLNKDLLIDMVTPQVAVHGLGPVINGNGENLELSFKGRTEAIHADLSAFLI